MGIVKLDPYNFLNVHVIICFYSASGEMKCMPATMKFIPKQKLLSSREVNKIYWYGG